MNVMRRFVLILVCSAVAFGAMAGERNLTRAESDSISHALATLWGDYLVKKAAKDGEAVSGEYMRGVQEALKLAQVDDAYFEGLQQGVMIAQRLRQVEEVGGFKVDIPKFAYVLTRIEKGRPSGFTQETADRYLNWFMTKIAEENEVVDGSAAYLEEAAKKEGVVKTPSGLLFEVVTEGEGESPLDNDLVLVNYVGRLINGTEFNRPENENGVIFEVDGLIPGFREGLKMMKKGGTYRLYIPSDIGYGEEGVPGLIPGGAATVFDVTLIDLRHRDADGKIIEETVPAVTAPDEK